MVKRMPESKLESAGTRQVGLPRAGRPPVVRVGSPSAFGHQPAHRCLSALVPEKMRFRKGYRLVDQTILRPTALSAFHRCGKNIQHWVNEVRDRMSRPHVVADALFIRYEDMSSQQALAVIGRITNDLRRGVPWPKVYKQYSEEFGYKTGNTTKIGVYGHLVVFPDPAAPGSGHMSQGEVFEWHGTPLPRRPRGFGVLRSRTSSDAFEGQCRRCDFAARRSESRICTLPSPRNL
jgi:hypothetical protein